MQLMQLSKKITLFLKIRCNIKKSGFKPRKFGLCAVTPNFQIRCNKPIFSRKRGIASWM